MLSWATIMSFVMKHKTAIAISLVLVVTLIAFGVVRLQLRHCRSKYDKLKKQFDATLVAQETCEKSVAAINGAVLTAKKDCAREKASLKAAYEFGKEERDKYHSKVDKLFADKKKGDKANGAVTPVTEVTPDGGIFDYQAEVTDFYNEVNEKWNAFADKYEGGRDEE